VAIVQSEFRGLPGGRKPTPRGGGRISEEQRQTIEARQRDETSVPAPTAPTDEADPDREEAPPRRPRRQARRGRSAETAAPPPPPVATSDPEPEPEPAPEPEPEPEPEPDDLVRLFINFGRRDGFREEVFVEQLAELAGLEPEDIAAIEPHIRHSYLQVPAEYATDLIEALDGETVGEKAIRIERARNES